MACSVNTCTVDSVICSLNAALGDNGTANRGGNNADTISKIEYWPTMVAGNVALTKVVAGDRIDDNIVISLSNAVNAEIARYNENPSHNTDGTIIYYSGGSAISTTDFSNLENTVARESLWQQIVLKTNALLDAHTLASTKLNISDYKKSDGPDLISALNINTIIDRLIEVSGHTNAQQCKCNVVCTCNGNCGCHYSDIRLKEEIEEINPRIIDNIKPIKFKYKLPDNAKVDNRSFHYGIEAQSLLESEIKDSSAIKQDKDGFYKVEYQELIGILIAEVQSLRKEINEIKQK